MEPFKIHILGCGSALPTLKHNASSQLIEMRGKCFMVEMCIRDSKYGADPVRFYMMTNSEPWDNLKFDPNGVDETLSLIHI